MHVIQPEVSAHGLDQFSRGQTYSMEGEYYFGKRIAGCHFFYFIFLMMLMKE